MRKRESRPEEILKTATRLAKAHANITALPGYQRHEPITAEDRHEAAVLAAAAALGYRLGTRCLRCGHWIVAPRSVAAHMGPVCRAKVAGR